MKHAVKFLLVLAFVFLLSQALSKVSPGLLAQEAGGSPERQQLLESVPADSTGERAAQLAASITTAIDRGDEMLARLAEAGVEDSLVLELQISSLRVQLMSEIHELADVLHDMEQEGPQDQLRAEVERTYIYVTSVLWSYIDRRSTEVDVLRNRRHSAEVPDLPALEDDIAELSVRLDEAYRFGQVHIEKLDKLGMASEEARSIFTGRLSARAQDLSGRIALVLQRIDRLSARLEDTPDEADLPVLLVAAHKSLESNTSSMIAVLDIMDVFELSTETYRAQLAEATRDISTVLLDSDAAARLAKRVAGRVGGWLLENGPSLLVKLVLFVGILFVFWLLSRIARRLVGLALDSSRLTVSTLLRRMIIAATANIIKVLGLFIALSQLGISMGPLLAGFGVIGFIVGFALQDTLANFASGMMILIYQPYDVGDMVDAGGVFGKVHKMSLVSTTILTIDNQTIVVPNSKVWGDVIKNVTAQKLRRVDMVFGISYTDDIPKAERVLEDILKDHQKVLDDPPFAVKLNTLGESSVDFVVRPWVAVDDYWDVYWDVTRAVKLRFDEEGISIPFPQRDVHIVGQQCPVKPEKETTDD